MLEEIAEKMDVFRHPHKETRPGQIDIPAGQQFIFMPLQIYGFLEPIRKVFILSLIII